MKLPEQLFVVINPLMRMFLHTPFHWLLSNSVMLITFTGRKTGRHYTTPVRYIKDGETVRCFSSDVNRWWKNLRGGGEVVLRIRGRDGHYAARLIEDDPVEIEQGLRDYFDRYPEDAVYHDARLTPDKQLVEADLPSAVRHAIVVEATPVQVVPVTGTSRRQ